ncbi:hypothetical protein N0V83_003672 [Neocucurbitaria cava]|uniref:Uncharacterized protein n=1 Tax=Neocucurbitaria cava TaxID=798079 RepID=A0A9W8YC68_9PLEO|nr:hypothetical protein N0V83_003672 [Neocucurbitaria cava]
MKRALKRMAELKLEYIDPLRLLSVHTALLMRRSRPEISKISSYYQSQANEAHLQSLATQCSQLQCAPLAATILTRLPPRELRDYIYNFLWTADDGVVEKLDAAMSAHDAPTGLSSHAIASLDLPVPFFADATFVGRSFAEEAAMWYFRMLSCVEVDYRYVRGYLERSTFGPMLFIPSTVIRQLTITIEWLIHDGGGRLDYAALQDSMNSLLVLQDRREDLAIEVYLSRDLQFSRTLFHVLEAIKPVFHALEQKKSGTTIKVMGYQFFTPAWRHTSLPTTTTTPQGKKTHATVELLNYYFDAGTPEQWLAMKDKEIEAIPQAQRREKCQDVRIYQHLYRPCIIADILQILQTMRNNLADMHGVTCWKRLK